MKTILDLFNIHKSFGKTKAVDGVTFGVPKGSIFGILGPNGSGKTTLLGIILDVLSADSGNYCWFGQQPTADQRKRIGSLLETPNFYPYLSAARNLEITAQISGRGNTQEIGHILKAVNLHDKRNRRFSSFSLGMKQRLAIGAALMGNPTVIVLDEPTNGLDPVGIVEVRQLIIDLNKKGHTIIIASHLLDEVEKICTHVAIMKKGDLLVSGPVDQVLKDEDLVEIGACNLNALITVINNYPGIIDLGLDKNKIVIRFRKGQADLAQINSFCMNYGIVLDHLRLHTQRLETRFFELTQN